MVEYVAAVAGLITACGVATRPLFRYLTEREYVKSAERKDLPEIARALHPQIEMRRNSKHQPEPPVDGGGESTM